MIIYTKFGAMAPRPPSYSYLLIVSFLFFILINLTQSQNLAQNPIDSSSVSNSESVSSDIEKISKLFSTLPNKLAKKNCWLLSKYFAHNTLDPIKSEIEVAKYGGGGGYLRNFNCDETMKYWKRKIVPKNLNVLVVNGLRFINQKHLLEGGQGQAKQFSENEVPVQIDQNVPPTPRSESEQDYLEVDGRARAGIHQYLDLENSNESETLAVTTENHPQEKENGIYTIFVFVSIGIIVICLLIATCIAVCRYRRDHLELDGQASEEALPGVVGSGLSGVSGEGKIGIGSNSSIQEFILIPPGLKRSSLIEADINTNDPNLNVVINVGNGNENDYGRRPRVRKSHIGIIDDNLAPFLWAL